MGERNVSGVCPYLSLFCFFSFLARLWGLYLEMGKRKVGRDRRKEKQARGILGLKAYRGTSVPSPGTPITAASRILGCEISTASSSAGATWFPLYLMSS